MQFTEDKPSGNYTINTYTPNSIIINNRTFESSIYVSPATLIENVPLQKSEHLSIDSIQFIIELCPEILILGTGQILQFPSPSIIAFLAQQNIGFEAMDHSAACRTFAVLAAEQRNVGALLLIDREN